MNSERGRSSEQFQQGGAGSFSSSNGRESSQMRPISAGDLQPGETLSFREQRQQRRANGESGVQSGRRRGRARVTDMGITPGEYEAIKDKVRRESGGVSDDGKTQAQRDTETRNFIRKAGKNNVSRRARRRSGR